MKSDIALWNRVKSELAIGDSVLCLVDQHRPFGLIVMIESFPIWGVVERIRMEADGYRTPTEYPPAGASVNAVVLGFRDYSQQVELAMPPKHLT